MKKMKYKIVDIKISKDTNYDKVLYWKLFRIYCSYGSINPKINKYDELYRKLIYGQNPRYQSLEIYSAEVGEYGDILVRDIIDNNQHCEEFYNFVYYKELLIYWLKAGYARHDLNDLPPIESILNAKSLEELKSIFDLDNHKVSKMEKEAVNERKKLWGVEGNNIIEVEVNDYIKRYYDRIVKSIPQSILKQIKNIELFKLGYIDKNTYDNLMTFKDELKDWLEHPAGTNLNIKLDSQSPDIGYFHDNNYTIKIDKNDLILESDKNIKFINSEVVFDNQAVNLKDIRGIKFEGYKYSGFIEYDKKLEFCFEIFYGDGKQRKLTTLIITSDNVVIE